MKHAVKFEDLREGDTATVEVTIANDVFTVTGPVRRDAVKRLNILGYTFSGNMKFISAEREGPEFAAGTIGQGTFESGRSTRGVWTVTLDGENRFVTFVAMPGVGHLPRGNTFLRSHVVRFVEEKQGSVDWEAMEDAVGDVLCETPARSFHYAVDGVMDAVRRHVAS